MKSKSKKKVKKQKAIEDFKQKSQQPKIIEKPVDGQTKKNLNATDQAKHQAILEELQAKEDLKTGLYDIVKKEIKTEIE